MRALMLSALAVLCIGCAPQAHHPLRSSLEVRALQTREYQTQNTKMVMKALLNVLQDEGFSIKNAVTDLGLITATKEADTESTGDRIMSSVLMGNDAVWERGTVTEASCNVSEFGKETRVRVTFTRKVYDNRGNVMGIEDLDDPYYYQDFFAKVDKGIFIQKQRI